MRLALVQRLVAHLLGAECGYPTLAVRSIHLVGAEQRTGGPLSSSSPSSLLGADAIPSVAANAAASWPTPTLSAPRRRVDGRRPGPVEKELS